MLHPSTDTFATAPSGSSPMALVASQHVRWREVYEQASEALDALGPDPDRAEKERLQTACGHGSRRADAFLAELVVTPCRSLRDLGLKARVVERCQRGGETTEAEDMLAASLIAEFMAISDLPKLRDADFTPAEILPEFVEPPALPLPPAEPAPVRTEAAAGAGCPAAMLGRQFARAVEMFDVLDAKPRADAGVDVGLVTDAMASFEDATGFVRATSAEGALAQMAMGSLDILAERAVDDTSDQSARWRRKRHARACLWSVRHYLEQHLGADGSRVGADYYMPETCDDIGLATKVAATSDGEARAA